MSGLSRAEQSLLRRLARRKGREAEGLFLAEGIRVVEELLASGIPPRLVVTAPGLEETDRGRLLFDTLARRAPVRRVPDRELSELADTATTQGVLVAAEVPRPDLDALRFDAFRYVLVLDGIQDPGNLGTLARTAAAFGCDLLASLPGTVDPWNPKAVRAAAGALFRYPVLAADLTPLAARLRAADLPLFGADAGGDPVDDVVFPPRVALALGNEGAGLSPGVRERCRHLIAVPMRGGTESLNVATAGSILLYLMTRERR